MTEFAVCEPCAGVSAVLCEPQANSEESESHSKPVRERPEGLLDMYTRSSGRLSEEQSQVAKQLLLSEQDLFSKGLDDLGSTSADRHYIETGTAAPIKQQPCHLPMSHKKEATGAIKEIY